MKIVIVGSSSVGKSAIVTRLVQGEFIGDATATCGADFYNYDCSLSGDIVKMQIWDTAGQERFRSISKSYFRNAVGAILVFDISNLDSFDELAAWLGDLHSLCAVNAQILLVGNKSDLENERQVSQQKVKEFADEHHLEYIETSAKTGKNVVEAFTRLAYEIVTKINNGEIQVAYPIGMSSDALALANMEDSKKTLCC